MYIIQQQMKWNYFLKWPTVQDEINNSIAIKESKFIVKVFWKKNPDSFTGEFYHLKKK